MPPNPSFTWELDIGESAARVHELGPGRASRDVSPTARLLSGSPGSNLGVRLVDRFSRTGVVADLGEAIHVAQEAVDANATETTRQVEVAVAIAMPRDHSHQFEARISVVWELRQCIQEELGQEPCLSRVLTVTEERPSHAWAASCKEYVKSTWGDPGVMFLDNLEKALSGIQLNSPGMYFKLVFLSGAYINDFRPK